MLQEAIEVAFALSNRSGLLKYIRNGAVQAEILRVGSTFHPSPQVQQVAKLTIGIIIVVKAPGIDDLLRSDVDLSVQKIPDLSFDRLRLRLGSIFPRR